MNKRTPERPNQDGQFRLLPCLCGADEAVYSYCTAKDGGRFRVVCPVCHRKTEKRVCKHDAQQEWNEAYRRPEAGK